MNSARKKIHIGLTLGLLMALGGCGAWWAIRSGALLWTKDHLQTLVARIAEFGPWGPILFVLLYITTCVAMLPAAFLTLSAGAVFGFARGILYVSIGATLGAAAAFLVSRYFIRAWVMRNWAHRPLFIAVDQAVTAEGWKIVLLTRLSPAVPFFILNYVFGLTRVSFRHYLLATWIGILPSSTVVVYLGSLAHPGEASDEPWVWVLKGLGLIATVAVTIHITRIARRALALRLPPVPTKENPPEA